MPAARAAALAAVLAASLASCARTPAFTEQRAPSGRVYRVVAIGEMPLGSGKALGVEYLADSLGDAERLGLDAEELLTLLSGQADSGGFGAVVVTAYQPSRWAFPRKGRSSTTVFTRAADGVWRSRKASPPEDAAARAADLRALDEVYARIERAVSARDARDLQAVQADGFWHRLADGTLRARAEENAALEKGLDSVSELSARMSVSSVTVSGTRAVVVAAMTSQGRLKSSGRRFTSTTVSRDVWIKTPEGWRLGFSADLDDRFEPAGRRR